MEYISSDSIFLKNDPRKNRWAIPYNYEAINARTDVLLGKNSRYIKDKTILDLGCHFGTFSYLCLKVGAKKVVGLDSDPELIKQAEDFFSIEKISKKKYKFLAGDVLEYLSKLPEKSFDTILCFGLLYYIPENYYLLSLMKKVAREVIILDTFTAYYNAIQGKDGPGIFKTLTPDSYELPLLVHSLTKATKKKNYQLNSHTFKTQPTENPLTLLTCPTIPLLELYFKTLGLKAKKLSWTKYLDKPNLRWQEMETKSAKANAHWSDLYTTDVRVSYLLKVD